MPSALAARPRRRPAGPSSLGALGPSGVRARASVFVGLQPASPRGRRPEKLLTRKAASALWPLFRPKRPPAKEALGALDPLCARRGRGERRFARGGGEERGGGADGSCVMKDTELETLYFITHGAGERTVLA